MWVPLGTPQAAHADAVPAPQTKRLQAELGKRGIKVYGRQEELSKRLASALRREEPLSAEQEQSRDAELLELAMAQVGARPGRRALYELCASIRAGHPSLVPEGGQAPSQCYAGHRIRELHWSTAATSG